jgi:DNA-binding NarL/FixJ family response regulator
MNGGDSLGTDAAGGAVNRLDRQRRLLAELCRMLDPRQPRAVASRRVLTRSQNGFALPAGTRLTPRMAQTLERLLAGDSEKQIAGRLGRSPHTIHVYVKELYKRFGVSSRGELFSRFLHDASAREPG